MLTNTRINDISDIEEVNLSHALLNPSAKFGGLYAPKQLPKLDDNFFKKHENSDYTTIALDLIDKFKFDVDMKIFQNALKRYAKFDDEPTKILKLKQNVYINELWHGPTRAFKDMALQPFGEILTSLAKNENKNYLIMCATSGDTGPATLESFCDMPNIKVVCLYPENGTSQVQRLQMVNANGKNIKVIGIKGNFDDAQRALKELLGDEDFKSELMKNSLSLSAANSVNFGRILFQIIYHIYAVMKISKNKQPTDIIVPSGNFGNALGAYYAKLMGANINKIKIASNINNILTELFTTGTYDLRNKQLIQTISPAMDILISSNVERLLFDKFGPKRTKELMDKLNKDKVYQLTSDELTELRRDFVADFCNDDECMNFIKNTADEGILIDPHTATCLKLLDEKTLTIITSTAQWVKFTPSMIKAIFNRNTENELNDMKKLSSKFNEKIPNNILKLFTDKEIHKDIVNKNEIKYKIIDWIKE